MGSVLTCDKRGYFPPAEIAPVWFSLHHELRRLVDCLTNSRPGYNKEKCKELLLKAKRRQFAARSTHSWLFPVTFVLFLVTRSSYNILRKEIITFLCSKSKFFAVRGAFFAYQTPETTETVNIWIFHGFGSLGVSFYQMNRMRYRGIGWSIIHPTIPYISRVTYFCIREFKLVTFQFETALLIIRLRSRIPGFKCRILELYWNYKLLLC